MAAITQRDYEAMLGCIARLHDCDDLEQFPRVTLTEIPKLVGADHATFNYVAPSVPKVIVLENPDLTGSRHAERERVFAQYLSDQPILKHFLSTGDPGAYKLSDFHSVREYHRLPLYRHLYHVLHYEDQIAFMLFPPGSEMIAIALARDRRNFTERDRQVLNLLRPHVAHAYRHVEKVALLKRAAGWHDEKYLDARVTGILLDGDDRPVQFGVEAQQWMSRFFPGRPRDRARLPEPVTDWLRRARNAGLARPLGAGLPDVMVQEHNGERLRLRVFSEWPGAGRILVLGLESVPGAAHRNLAGKLTPREIEVLLQVEQGKTNEETAAVLGISPMTVRTHLEHIFDKLGVSSRTAAVTRFRQQCSGR